MYIFFFIFHLSVFYRFCSPKINKKKKLELKLKFIQLVLHAIIIFIIIKKILKIALFLYSLWVTCYTNGYSECWIYNLLVTLQRYRLHEIFIILSKRQSMSVLLPWFWLRLDILVWLTMLQIKNPSKDTIMSTHINYLGFYDLL